MQNFFSNFFIKELFFNCFYYISYQGWGYNGNPSVRMKFIINYNPSPPYFYSDSSIPVSIGSKNSPLILFVIDNY